MLEEYSYTLLTQCCQIQINIYSNKIFKILTCFCLSFNTPKNQFPFFLLVYLLSLQLIYTCMFIYVYGYIYIKYIHMNMNNSYYKHECMCSYHCFAYMVAHFTQYSAIYSKLSIVYTNSMSLMRLGNENLDLLLIF